MTYWSSNETKALVLAWKETMVENQLNDMPIARNSMIYMEIVQRMERQGYEKKNWKQCRTKMKGLVSKI